MCPAADHRPGVVNAFRCTARQGLKRRRVQVAAIQQCGRDSRTPLDSGANLVGKGKVQSDQIDAANIAIAGGSFRFLAAYAKVEREKEHECLRVRPDG